MGMAAASIAAIIGGAFSYLEGLVRQDTIVGILRPTVTKTDKIRYDNSPQQYKYS